MALLALCVLTTLLALSEADQILQLNEEISFSVQLEPDQASRIKLSHGFEGGKNITIIGLTRGPPTDFAVRVFDADGAPALVCSIGRTDTYTYIMQKNGLQDQRKFCAKPLRYPEGNFTLVISRKIKNFTVSIQKTDCFTTEPYHGNMSAAYVSLNGIVSNITMLYYGENMAGPGIELVDEVLLGTIQADEILQLNEEISFSVQLEPDQASRIKLSHGFDGGKNITINGMTEGPETVLAVSVFDADGALALVCSFYRGDISIIVQKFVPQNHRKFCIESLHYPEGKFTLVISREIKKFTVFIQGTKCFSTEPYRGNMSTAYVALNGTGMRNVSMLYYGDNTTCHAIEKVDEALLGISNDDTESKCKLDLISQNASIIGDIALPCRFERNSTLMLIGKASNRTEDHNEFTVNLYNSDHREVLGIRVLTNAKKMKVETINYGLQTFTNMSLTIGEPLTFGIKIIRNMYEFVINQRHAGEVPFVAERGYVHGIQIDGDIVIDELRYSVLEQ